MRLVVSRVRVLKKTVKLNVTVNFQSFAYVNSLFDLSLRYPVFLESSSIAAALAGL